MIAYMRNVRTGEIKGVDLDSDEHEDLKSEVYDAGGGTQRPMWEQTGKHHVNRINSGDIQVPEDLGDDFSPPQDVSARTTDFRPDPHPERNLTAAEVEAGIKSHDEKMANLGISNPNAAQIEEGISKAGSEPDEDEGDREPSLRELRDRARELGIVGFSSMNKAQLSEAINDADEDDDEEV